MPTMIIPLNEVAAGDRILGWVRASDMPQNVDLCYSAWKITRVDAERVYYESGGKECVWGRFYGNEDLYVLVDRHREYANPERAAALRAYLETMCGI